MLQNTILSVFVCLGVSQCVAMPKNPDPHKQALLEQEYKSACIYAAIYPSVSSCMATHCETPRHMSIGVMMF
ncbi:MAG: hypothetical protein LBH38_00330 [Holosporales bacterium]|jgi:hypothetical protein|nr:hypothetical protein [Holosporales bacterium]